MMNNTQKITISIIELTINCIELFHKTLEYAKKRDFINAQRHFDKGNELLLKVNSIHSQLLSDENKVDLLLVYAEDLLMSVQIYKLLMKELIDLYKKFPTCQGNK